MADKNRSHYQVLQVARNASADVIHSAYRALSKRFHPDSKETSNKEELAAVQRAHEVLMDSVQRKAYDEQLQREWAKAAKGKQQGAKTKANKEPEKSEAPFSGVVTEVAGELINMHGNPLASFLFQRFRPHIERAVESGIERLSE